MWCADPDTTCGKFGKPKTEELGLMEPSEHRDLSLIEAARPLATTKEQRRALWFKEKRKIKRLRAKYKIQRQMELKDRSWNDKKQRTRVYADEMVEIWQTDDWPDLVHQDFVDFCTRRLRWRSWPRNEGSNPCPMQQ